MLSLYIMKIKLFGYTNIYIKKVESYIKECEDNGFEVKKMEVRVVDWNADDNPDE